MKLSKYLGELIRTKHAQIAVVGLGYVGLPVACEFARAGFNVTGVDILAARVAMINSGISPIEGIEPGLSELLKEVIDAQTLKATTQYADIANADIVTINVETPVDDLNAPRYTALRAACKSIGQILRPGMLVVIESTVAPGTTQNIVQPLLEQYSGMSVASEQGFFLGTCPERVMPGRLLRNLRTIPRVCGGDSAATATLMRSLYAHVVDAEIDTTDILTAEFVKTTENAYRDVQIAFANEVAQICESAGADVFRIRELVNKSPGRHMLIPGAGVGGHCIPKDPWLLAHAAADRSTLAIIPAARSVNEHMPLHVAQQVRDLLSLAGSTVSLDATRILVLGYAYLEDSDDTRHSPSQSLIEHLHSFGYETCTHDPYIANLQGDPYALAINCDAAVIMVAHSQYRDLDFVKLAHGLRRRTIIDGRNVVPQSIRDSKNVTIRWVGRGA